MQNIKKYLKNRKTEYKKIQSQLYYDQCDYRGTVLIAGTGRSGTTWLENIINYDNSYRIMFEPFHSVKNDLLVNWKYRQYISPQNQDSVIVSQAHKILSGNIRNHWVDRFNKKVFANKRIIKDIRVLLFLKWIKINFPEIPIILLLRHPCAVANSKLQNQWNTHLDEFLSQDDLLRDYLAPFKNYISKAKGNFEKHIYSWCIENYVPLHQFMSEEMLVIFYENLCINFNAEVEKIFKFINKDMSHLVYDQYSIPSDLCRKDSAIMCGENLIENWRKYIDNSQLKKCVEICSLFGLNEIYNECSMPLLNDNKFLNI